MIALPGKFRIKVYNGVGVALAAGDVSVKVCFQKFDINASVVETTVQTIYQNAAEIPITTYAAGAWFDNSTTKYVSFHGLCSINVTGAPVGSVKVYIENSTDGTAAPSDSRGWMLTEMSFSAAALRVQAVKV